MKLLKKRKINFLQRILKNSLISFFTTIIFISVLFIGTKIHSATIPSLTVVSTTSNSVTLTASGLTIGNTYRINIVEDLNGLDVIKSNWDLENVTTGTITTTSPSQTPLDSGTYTAKLSGPNATGNYAYIANSPSFNILPADPTPVITGFSPASGKVGDIVTIHGNNFLGADRVYFGLLSFAIPKTVNNTTITVEVPKTAITQKLYVEVLGQSVAQSQTDFIVIPNNTPGNTTTPNPSPTGTQTNVNPTIEWRGLVPVCNTGEINPDTNNFDVPCDFNMIMHLINKVINFLLVVLATPLFALIIIYVAWLYLSDMGNASNITKAKTIMKNAVLGYVIALAAWLIVKTILLSLGYEGYMFLG